MNKLLFIFFLLTPLLAKAQFDPEAIDVIRPISQNILNSSGVEIDFVFTFENKQEEIVETHEGKAFLKGNKFKLSLLEVVSYFDGTSQWIHMVDEGEVNISEPDPEDEEEFTPINIFSMYEHGFRFKTVETLGNLVTIDMLPDDATKPYHKIRLKLDKENQTFVMVKSFGRDGVDNTIEIKSTKKELNLTDDYFVFKATDHPNVDVIDMR